MKVNKMNMKLIINIASINIILLYDFDVILVKMLNDDGWSSCYCSYMYMHALQNKIKIINNILCVFYYFATKICQIDSFHLDLMRRVGRDQKRVSVQKCIYACERRRKELKPICCVSTRAVPMWT